MSFELDSVSRAAGLDVFLIRHSAGTRYSETETGTSQKRDVSSRNYLVKLMYMWMYALPISHLVVWSRWSSQLHVQAPAGHDRHPLTCRPFNGLPHLQKMARSVKRSVNRQQ